jgi:hypothetical protein
VNHLILITYHHYGYGHGCANENGRGKTCLGSRVTRAVNVMAVVSSFIASLLFFFFSSSGSVGSFSPAAPTRSRVLEQLRLLIGLLGPLL